MNFVNFFEHDVNDNYTLDIDEIDPDINYFNNFVTFNNDDTCKYYSIDGFNEEYFQKFPSMQRENDLFSLIHVNIRSMSCNISTFEHFLESLNLDYYIIGLSETWLNQDNNDLFTIQGYSCVNNYRTSKTGGGVSLFLKDHLQYTLRADLSIFNESLESVFVEINNVSLHGRKRNIVVGVIYRPPAGDGDLFHEHLGNILSAITRECKQSFLMGDFNYDLLRESSNGTISQFIELMYSYSHVPIITRPTRIDERTSAATLIDNIFTNTNFQPMILHGINCVKIADHFPIFCVYNTQSIIKTQQSKLRRNFSEHYLIRFVESLTREDWEDVMSATEAQIGYQLFYTKIKCHYDACFPWFTPRSVYKERKPWLSVGLRNAIKRKNKLYRKSIRNPTLTNKENYKQYRNTLKSLLKTAEKEHYSTLMNCYKKDLKKSWKIIKEVLNKNTPFTDNEIFQIDDEASRNPNQIAEAFNSYFVNVGPKLAEKISPSQVDPTSKISRNQNSIFMEPTDEEEVTAIVKS